ncbi:elongin-A-like isoform X2 [Rhinatrema bivittatum]|uniref:elongin-A-like isoform X2 n=1 Tax=Rhinatrema bivittatum TaxID=194408 RepID=UPI00112DB99B|nr:elongin-A-like isoform X2 [Rhinatrema bivittatum]
MADCKSVVQRVLQLKERLSGNQDPKKIMKALKGLQDLNISLDILGETGIGKTVNGFRKHVEVGEMAKSLVNHWKKLVPERKSDERERPNPERRKELPSDKTNAFCSKQNQPSTQMEQASETLPRDYRRLSRVDENKNKHSSRRDKRAIKAAGAVLHSKELGNSGLKKHSQNTPQITSNKDCKNTSRKAKPAEKTHSNAAKRDPSPQEEKQVGMDQPQSKAFEPLESFQLGHNTESTKESYEDEFEPPTMSFESYLNYDQVSSKRKKRANPEGQPQKLRVCKPNRASSHEDTPVAIMVEERQISKDDQSETPTKKAKIESLRDLLNVPLPKFLPEYASMSSPPYYTDYKAPIIEAVPQQGSITSEFTGRRLNSKMQVYSGSKPIYLLKMLTLYEQCIRVLQNNIDSLYDVGGVPFELLEPVLERCTPEQLNRIEDCNPIFIGESDHLWKRHCQRDFKNEQLQEYESWREMYLRVFSEREQKLKMITKNISSAHSLKPKGRQVKLAYIHSVAKPPRNVRRQQEIYGTAGPIAQSHPLDKNRLQKMEKEKSNTLNCSNSTSHSTATTSSTHSNGTSLDAKKTIKKIAPIMAKTMRAFKNRVGPR